MAITSNGGTITYNNTATGTAYAETLGTLALTTGQLNVVSTNAVTSGTETLTFGAGSLTHSAANTSAITFSGGSLGASAKNSIIIDSQATTDVGTIIGPWATWGTTAAAQSDYATYNITNGAPNAFGIQNAAIAASADSTWTDSTKAYTSSTGGALALGATEHNMLGLRNTGATTVMTIPTGGNLNTYGLLNGVSTLWTVAATGTGALSTPTGGGNLFVTAGSGPITISAPINNNGGNVTLVQSGSGTLTLSGTNTFSGGLVVSGGTLVASADTNLGAASGGMTFNGTCTFGNDGSWIVGSGRTITVSAGANVTFNFGGATFAGPVVGSGTFTVGKPSQGNPGLSLTNTGNTFTGAMNLGDKGANGYASYTFNSLGDASGAGIISLGYGGQGAYFIWGAGATAPLVLNYRQFDIGGSPGSFITNNNTASSNANTITINTDMLFTGAGSRTLTLGGSNTGNNTIAGKIPNGPTGTVISLTKADAGKWVLSGANTYSGGTTVNAGTLTANAANALSTGNVTVAAGTLQIDAADAMADTAALRLPSATTKNLTMNANDTIGSLFLAGLQQPNGAYTSSGAGSAWMNAASGILQVGSLAAQPLYWDLNGMAAGAVLNPPDVDTAAGTWNAGNTNWNALADGSGSTAAWAAGRTATFAAGTDASGTYTVTVDGTQDIGGLTFEEGNVTLSPGTAGGLRMTSDSLAYVNTGLTATIATPISQDATARSFTKGGAGTLILNAANDYTGATTLNQGTLRLTNTGALAGSSSMSIANGTTLELRSDTAAAFTTPVATLASGATTTIDVNNNGSGSGNTLTLSGGIATPTNVTTKVNVTGGNGYSLSIPTVAQIAGTLTFNPTTANLSLGTVTINCIGDASFILDGTTTGNTVTSITDIGVISNLSYMTKQGTGTWTVGNITTTKGMIITAGKLIVNGTLWQNKNDRSITLSGASTELHLNNPAAVRNQPSATVKALVISGGKLDNSSGAAITTSTYNPTMGWNGDFTFIGSQGSASDLYLGTGAVSLSATRIVTIQNAATTLTVGGVISGTGFGITKAGDGTLALSGANAYTGPTAINQGTLLVNGSLNAASAVAVNATGTLGGTGTINGAVTVNTGGTLAPGASAGTLTVNNSLAMGSGSTYIWQLGSTLADLVDVNGTLSIASSWTLKLMSDGGTPGAGEYNLFTYDAFSGSFALPTIDPAGTWKTAKVAQDTVGKRIYLSFALPGDTNSDFVVDAADYITLKKNFGSTTAADAQSGNFTTPDTTVDWADLNILTTNFGAGSGGAPAMTPEPCSALLLVFGAAGLLRRRARIGRVSH